MRATLTIWITLIGLLIGSAAQSAEGKAGVLTTSQPAVYAKVILPVNKPVTSEYPPEPWITKDLATRGKPDYV